MRFFACLSLLFVSVSCVDELDPPAYGVYQVYGLVAEVTGGLKPDPTLPSVTSTVTTFLIRTAFSGPLSQPDFITSPTVPQCLASTFVLQEDPPGGNEIDAGDLTFSGLQPTDASLNVVEFLDQTPEFTTLPNPVTCVQADDPFYPPPGVANPLAETDIRHVCNDGRINLQYVPFRSDATAFGPGTSVTVTTDGGGQAGSFQSNPILPPPVLLAAPGFDLGAVDPRQGITVRWTPVEAPLVLIEVIATRLSDGVGAQILCLEPMTSLQKTIPDGALALLPSPELTATGFVTVVANIAAVNVDSNNEGWGTYLVGVGRGSFGMNYLFAPPP